MNFSRFGLVSAAAASVALTACTTGTHEISTSTRSAHAGLSAQRRIDAAFAQRGAEIEHGTTVMISEGNRHMVYPGSASVVRTAAGVTVTINGTVSRFSPDAIVDRSGVYHKYAAR